MQNHLQNFLLAESSLNTLLGYIGMGSSLQFSNSVSSDITRSVFGVAGLAVVCVGRKLSPEGLESEQMVTPGYLGIRTSGYYPQPSVRDNCIRAVPKDVIHGRGIIK